MTEYDGVERSTATETLRAILDERGVEWSSPSGLNSSFADSITFIGDVAVVSEIDGSDLLRINFDGTPEQAIAATLGVSDATQTRQRDAGTLTAEKVRELMEENSRQYPSPTDPYVWLTEYDWQAIADEMNATLGRGTCEVEGSIDYGEFGCWQYELSCGCRIIWPDNEPPRFCPECGARYVG